MESDITFKELRDLIETGMGAKVAMQGAKPYCYVPDGHKIHSLEDTLSNPVRKRGTATFEELDQFNQYVDQNRCEGTSIYCSTNPLSFTAIFNGHSTTKPGWGDFRATCNLFYSKEFKAWNSLFRGETLTQTGFADFLDQWPHTIETAAASIIEIVENLHAKVDVAFESKITRDGTGTIRAAYEETTTVGTRGSLALPSTLNVVCDVYNGMKMPVRLAVRVIPKVKDRKISFGFRVGPELDQFIEQVNRRLIEFVRSETGIQPVIGSFQ